MPDFKPQLCLLDKRKLQRERSVIVLRYGIGDGHSRTLYIHRRRGNDKSLTR